MLKKLVAALLTLVIALLSCQAFAEVVQSDDIVAVEPQYTHFTNVCGSFDIVDGVAQCYGSVRSRYTDTTTHVRITLQKRAANSTTWIGIYSWSGSSEGKATARVSGERKVSSGYDYRIYIKYTIKDADGVPQETDSMYSRIVSY